MTKRKPSRAPKAPPKPRRPGLLGATRIEVPYSAEEAAVDEAMLRAKKLKDIPARTLTEILEEDWTTFDWAQYFEERFPTPEAKAELWKAVRRAERENAHLIKTARPARPSRSESAKRKP